MTISLAFLAPDLVRTAVEGRLPRGLGVGGTSEREMVERIIASQLGAFSDLVTRQLETVRHSLGATRDTICSPTPAAPRAPGWAPPGWAPRG